MSRSIGLRALSLAAVLAAGIAAAAQTAGGDTGVIAGPVAARLVRVIDGDTVVVNARIWLGQEITAHVRIDGVDTPEIKGKCAGEIRMAAAARDFTARLLSQGEISLSDIRYGKYAGRVVARVRAANGEDSAEALLRRGLGRRYTGGKRQPWC